MYMYNTLKCEASENDHFCARYANSCSTSNFFGLLISCKIISYISRQRVVCQNNISDFIYNSEFKLIYIIANFFIL